MLCNFFSIIIVLFFSVMVDVFPVIMKQVRTLMTRMLLALYFLIIIKMLSVFRLVVLLMILHGVQ